MEKQIHFIIGGPRLGEDNVIYRRRRLLEYLAKKDSTIKVYWIYFHCTSIHNIGKITFPELPKKYESHPYNKIIQIEVADYKFLLSFMTVFQGFLVKRILTKVHQSENMYVWYTLHRFAKFSQLRIWRNMIYDCSDNWTNKDNKSIINKALDFLTTTSEKHIIKNTNIHTASSPFLKQKIESLSLKECHLIEHGYNPIMFKNKADKISKLSKLCFIGSLQGNKVDTKLLYSMAKLRPKWEFWIIGSITSENLKDRTYRLFVKLENVFIKDAIAPEQIPKELESMNVGLLPYKNTEFTKGIFPLKFYEYLASNLNVVGCNLASLNRFSDLGVYIQSSDAVEDFIEKCESGLKKEVPVEKYKQLLKEATWEKQFDKMYRLLQVNHKDN